MNEIRVVLPPISEDAISESLRDLTQILEEHTGTDNVQGFLGGRHGYGVEFTNDVFEMHPFWWGDCTCGYEDIEYKFYKSISHEDHCYQTEIKERLEAEGFKLNADGWLEDEGDFDLDTSEKYHVRKSEISTEVAKKYGLSDIGLYIHCTCTYKEKESAWYAENDHKKDCRIAIPNFRHFASGLEISWYKYIGRSMEINKDVNLQEWTTIFVDCINSLNAEGEPNV